MCIYVRHYELGVLFLPNEFPYNHRHLGFRLSSSYRPMRGPKRKPSKPFLIRQQQGCDNILFPVPMNIHRPKRYNQFEGKLVFFLYVFSMSKLYLGMRLRLRFEVQTQVIWQNPTK